MTDDALEEIAENCKVCHGSFHHVRAGACCERGRCVTGARQVARLQPLLATRCPLRYPQSLHPLPVPLAHLQRRTAGHQSLETLNLRFCWGITRDGLMSLLDRLPTLRVPLLPAGVLGCNRRRGDGTRLVTGALDGWSIPPPFSPFFFRIYLSLSNTLVARTEKKLGTGPHLYRPL